jgi:SAM-dependent methyltransferase
MSSPESNNTQSPDLGSSIDWKQYYNREHEIIRFVPETDSTELLRLEFVESLLPNEPMERILDAGCGEGYQCRTLARRCRFIAGCDIAFPRLQFARRYSVGLPLCNADLLCPPFREKSFDLVTLVEVLEHLPEPQPVLRELIKISRRYFLVTVPYRQNLQRVMCPHCLKTYMLDGHLHRFDEVALRTMLEEVGLRILGVKRFFLPGAWETARLLRWLPYRGRQIVRHSLQTVGLVAPDNAVFIGALCEIP